MSVAPDVEADNDTREMPITPGSSRPAAADQTPPRARFLRDSAIVAYRNLLTILRVPTLLVTATIQPLMFVFLFAYIFGASLGGDQYREFLLAGIFTQTVAFNAAFTTVGLAGDLQKGIIDRMRTLPMSRLAVLMGRTLSDLVVNVASLGVMVICGYIVGWRINGSIADAALAFAIILLFAFAMSWVGALTGLISPTVEVAQSAGLIWMFPLSFISSAFISAETLPGPLRTIAEWNPITAVSAAGRKLFDNSAPPSFAPATGWAADNCILYAVICSLVILAVAMPAALLQYRKVASH
ncbi:ABC transporter permease [Nocardia rosealba]|uniref:ABC transporter permease n=2 Tax=Nocardiaceae TaxID=85025 RepID=UPI001CDA4F81|nr:ABC transporter permease [Nocardia rosealba]MCA2208068.1 ABC transporter permease [Nocardia rosealba]